MKKLSSISGIILAGGYGKRMGGVEKGLIRIHEEPQYIFLYKLLRTFTDQITLSVRAEQQSLYQLPDEMSIVTDEYKDIGPLGGILSCLKKLDTTVLVLSCDLYQTEPETLEILISNRDSEYYGTVYFDEISGFLQPLCAIYEPSSISIIKGAVKKGDYSLHRLIRSHNFKILNTRNNRWFENMNC